RLSPDGKWQNFRQDFDWDTTIRWKQMVPEAETVRDSRPETERVGPIRRIARPDPYQVTITWQSDAMTKPGTYRIVHYGRLKNNSKVERCVATSRPFEVTGRP